jgi:hypothetical protein
VRTKELTMHYHRLWLLSQSFHKLSFLRPLITMPKSWRFTPRLHEQRNCRSQHIRNQRNFRASNRLASKTYYHINYMVSVEKLKDLKPYCTLGQERFYSTIAQAMMLYHWHQNKSSMCAINLLCIIRCIIREPVDETWAW